MTTPQEARAAAYTSRLESSPGAAAMLEEAADMLEACRAVGIRQEQTIMDQEREIARLLAALTSISKWPHANDTNTIAMRNIAIDALGPNGRANLETTAP